MKMGTKGSRICQILALMAIIAAGVALAITANYALSGNAKAETAQTDSGIAALAAENAGIKQVAAGQNHTMILFNNGKLYAMGDNSTGALGLGDTVDRTNFTEVTGLTDITSVACTFNDSFVIAKGKLYTAGYNYNKQCGLDEYGKITSFTEVPGLTNVTSVAGNGLNSMAIAGGKLYGTGNNQLGQLGLGDTADRARFTEVPGLTNVTAVSCGLFHTEVIAGGKLYVAGLNIGNLGDVQNVTSFTEITDITNVTSVASGYVNTLAITAGKLYGVGDLTMFGLEQVAAFTEISSLNQITNNATSVSFFGVSKEVAMAIAGGKLYAIGDNSKGSWVWAIRKKEPASRKYLV